MVTKNVLLGILPPFTNKQILIEENQEIHDIIKEVLNAHRYFANDYNEFFDYFLYETPIEIGEALFRFCKENIFYKIESDDIQTTKSPAAILAIGKGDCKHYAGFIGGVLSSINRNTNKKINWCFRFANYSLFETDVSHVFIVVKYKGAEYWIDPVLPSFNSRQQTPNYFIDKKINDMSLVRISGVGLIEPISMAPGGLITLAQAQAEQAIDFGNSATNANASTKLVAIPTNFDLSGADPITPQLQDDIKQLLYYGVIDSNMNLVNDTFLNVAATLGDSDAQDLQAAYGRFLNEMSSGGVGNIFDDIWNSVKQVSLAPVRAAFLALTSLNAFGLGSSLNVVIVNKDGSVDQPGIDNLEHIWHGSFRGDTNILLRAIRNGAKKPRIGAASTPQEISTAGVLAAGAAASAVAAPLAPVIAAGIAVLTAIAPVIETALKAKAATGMTVTSLPAPVAATTTTTTTTATSLTSMLPIILIGGAAFYFLTKKK
jgi:hypothetical protein